MLEPLALLRAKKLHRLFSVVLLVNYFYEYMSQHPFYRDAYPFRLLPVITDDISAERIMHLPDRGVPADHLRITYKTKLPIIFFQINISSATLR